MFFRSMVANAVVLLLGAWALGQQVVLAKKFKFKFDNVTQCEPVSISFTGSEIPADSIPVTLTLLPLNAPPVAISIPNAAINSSGVYVTFFPLKAGTQFLASLDDAEGDNSAKVSDLLRVMDSDDDSCLSSVASSSERSLFTVPDNIEQCGEFTINYVTVDAPTIRLVEPKGKSFSLNMSSFDPILSTATYIMNMSRQHDVALMLDSGEDQKNTTGLLHIAGDASTSEECLKKDDEEKNDDDDADAQEENSVGTVTLSNGAIIGVSVGAGVIILVSVLAILYILRGRKRKRKAENISFNPNLLDRPRSFDSMEKSVENDGFAPVRPFVPQYAEDSGYVRDPPYAMAKYSPTESNFSRSTRSVSSWGNALAMPERQSTMTYNRSTRSNIAPMDIVDLLNSAAIQNRLSAQQTAQQTPGARSSFGNLAIPRSPPARTYLRPDADGPEDPTTAVIPSFYTYGVGNASSARLSQASSSDLGVTIRPPPTAASGLPSSPRDRRQHSFGGIGGLSPYAASGRDSVSSWGNDRGVPR